mgnify:CR=1 FL=1
MKAIKIFFLISFFISTNSFANNIDNFNNWKVKFKEKALSNNISESTFNIVMANVKFLPKVIEYDRFQPEFYEDTKTYIKKRTSKTKIKRDSSFYKTNRELIHKTYYELNINTKLH